VIRLSVGPALIVGEGRLARLAEPAAERALGQTIPHSLLLRADEVNE